MTWRIELLGELRAVRSGIVVERFPTHKTASVLAYLAYHCPGLHSRAKLAGLFWPESPDRLALHSLSQSLHWIRRSLETPPTSDTAVFCPVVISRRTAVGLDAARLTTDVAEFRAAVQTAALANGGELGTLLTHAVDCWSGELLPGFYDDWILAEQEALAADYQRSLERLVDCLEGQGDFPLAIACCHRLLTVAPCPEEVHRHIMRMYLSMGQPESALRQYEQAEADLRRETGRLPGISLRTFARQVEQLANGMQRGGFRQFDVGRQARGTGDQAEIANHRSSTGNPRARLLSTRPPPNLLPPPNALLPPDALLPPNQGASGARLTLLRVDLALHEPRTGSSQAEAQALLDALLRVTLDRYEAVQATGRGRLVLFGTTTSHENESEHAILAALEMGAMANRLGSPLRIALESGTTAASIDHSGQPDLIPPTLFSQVRVLLDRAAPGEIVVGPAARRLAGRSFQFSPLDRNDRAIHTEAYLVCGSQSGLRAGLPLQQPPLVGRQWEKAHLREALDASISGRGSAVLLVGEAGLGKTRLIAELRRMAQVKNGAVAPLFLQGRCVELGIAVSYGAFADLLSGLFQIQGETDSLARGAALQRGLKGLQRQGRLSPRELDRVSPALGWILSSRFGNRWDRALDHLPPEQLKYVISMAIRDLILSFCRQGPVILVLEDVHWADLSTLDLLLMLMDVVRSAPLLLVCSLRPEDRCYRRLSATGRGKCRDRYTELVLQELSPDACRRLMHELLRDHPIDPAVEQAVLETVGGNPLFLEEVLRSLIESRALGQRHTGSPTENLAIAIPESIEAMIASRLARLPDGLAVLLEAAAVLGRVFEPILLARIVPESHPFGERLLTLEERGLIYFESPVPEETYAFKHVLFQQAIYGRLPSDRRAALHRRAAEAMEAEYHSGRENRLEQLAAHYDRSGSHAKAAEYLALAGERAARIYANDQAIRCFQRAAECSLGPSPEERGRRLAALRGLGEVHLHVGRHHEAERCFRQAISEARALDRPPAEVALLLWWQGETLWWLDRLDEMRAGSEEALELLHDAVCPELALVLTSLASSYRGLGHTTAFVDCADRLATLLPLLHYRPELRVCYNVLFNLEYVERCHPKRAARWVRALRVEAERAGDLTALATAYDIESSIEADRGLLSAACRLREEALSLLSRTGDLKHEIWDRIVLGRLRLQEGNLLEAGEQFKIAYRLAETLERREDAGISALWLGISCLCRADFGAATRRFRRALQLFRGGREAAGKARSLHLLARAALATGQKNLAWRLLQRAISSQGLNGAELAACLAALEHAGSPDDLASEGRTLDDLVRNDYSFRRFCCCTRQRFREGSALESWYGTPAEPEHLSERTGINMDSTCGSGWIWQDPAGGASLRSGESLEIRTPNGRDLCSTNHSAPRWIRPVSRHFALQCLTSPADDDTPAIGGLLLWMDDRLFLRLERGLFGADDVCFLGCIEGQDRVIGRARIQPPIASPGDDSGDPGQADRIWLRLERQGSHVRALASGDGPGWVALGEIDLPKIRRAHAGLYAIGAIPRAVYHGAYPEGAAVRFTRCTMESAPARPVSDPSRSTNGLVRPGTATAPARPASRDRHRTASSGAPVGNRSR